MAERWNSTIQTPADVARILAAVNREGLTRATTTALAEAVQPATRTELQPDASKLLPVDAQLAHLFPWPGLRKGATVAVDGSTSMLLLLLSAAMRNGSWAAVAGVPHLGCVAAAEMGIPLDRLALIPEPGPDWPTVVAALIDGFDLVVVGAPGQVAAGTVRSLQARARQRGCILIPTTAWPGADVVMSVTSRRWEGLGHGRGRLRRQVLQVQAAGRGRAAKPKTTTVVIGQPDRPLVIPAPPAGLYDDEPAAETVLWAHVEPNEPPDRWAALERQL